MRASRDGHEYHVAWAARVSLELLHPMTELKAISLEGFPVQEANSFSEEAIDIADLVKYFGGSTVYEAKRIDVLQLKYSPTKKNKGLTASDLSKTLQKFAQTKKDLKERLGEERAAEVTFFEFVSNRPIGANLEKAIVALKTGEAVQGHIGTQAETLKISIGLKDEHLKDFLERLSIRGAGSSLPNLISDVHSTIANWRGTSDPVARLGLKNICDLVRRKAGVSGAFNNIINDIDVLGELGIDDIDDIYPVPQSFPTVPIVLERPFLSKLEQKILSSTKPLIIHGTGGCGKTVVMQSLVNKFSDKNVVILFDGFGGGKWRAPGDDRHLCERGLLHIINSLAAKGLCDLVLPGIEAGTVLRTASKRLKQALDSARTFQPHTNIVLLLDAIDHAGMRAKATNTDSFAKLLLQRLDIQPIEGVKIVASCRPERRIDAYGSEDYPDFPIPVFSRDETKDLSQKRLDDISTQEISILFSRSGGNPRCLDMLLSDGRPFDDNSTEGDGELLYALIEKRFNRAVDHAEMKGTVKHSARSLISGLRLLPPPVPMDEIAACGLIVSEVESFFSDLFPLIDRTQHGLIFRDEPTETLAKKFVDQDKNSVDKLVERLKARQSSSAYAARALPPLLVEFNHVDELLELAFSEVFPVSASSTVAVRNIRLARIAAAITACVKANRNDDIFQLMMEAASAASGGQRSDRYVHDFPDLAATCGDTEALRRLFEAKVSWQGARYSSRAIANIIGDNFEDAVRDANKAIDWLNWSLHQTDDDQFGSKRIYETKDWIGAIYVLLLNGKIERVISWLDNRNPNDAYWFFSTLLELALRHEKVSKEASQCIDKIKKMSSTGEINKIWCLSSVCENLHCSMHQEKKIIRSIARYIDEVKEDEKEPWRKKQETSLTSALLVVATKAIKYKLREDAQIILGKLCIERPQSYDFTDGFLYKSRIPRWLIYSTLVAILERRKPSILDLVPAEIWKNLSEPLKKRGPKAIECAIGKLLNHNNNGKAKKKSPFDYETQREVQNAYTHRVKPLLVFANMIREIVMKSNNAIEIGDFIGQLDQGVKAASNYPYRSQKLFVADVGFNSIFNTANAVKAWTRQSSLKAVDWIKVSPIKAYPQLLRIVEGYATQPSAERATLQLGNYTLSCIKKDTEIEARIQSIGKLAHSIWNVSIEEARVIFRQGLELADAVGSDNNDEIMSLVHIAAEYTGEPLPSETVHNFGRLCELNFPYESEKFIWVGYGEALTRIGGVASIAIISRLADRNIVELGNSLPPLLTALIKNDQLEADLASSVIGLDSLSETWSWDMHNFAKPAFSKLSAKNKELLAKWITIEFDRTYQSSPPNVSIDKLLNIYHSNSISNSALRHFEAIKSQQNESSRHTEKYNHYRHSEDEKIVRPVDFDVTDVEALDNDIQQELSDDNRPFSRWRRIKEIMSNINDVDTVVATINAIAKVESLSIEDKLSAFKSTKDTWGKISVAVQPAIENAIFVATNMNATELIGEDWHVSSRLSDVFTLAPSQKPELLPAFMKSLQGNLVNLSSLDWLRFASYFASTIADGIVGNSLVRYIKLTAKDVPDDFGDLPWGKDFLLPGNNDEVIAGLIWHQLGSPSSKLRWRAAHSILRLAQIGRFDVIELLVEKLESETSKPFCHAKLPFYYFHSRLWLTIALAKLSIDFPAQLTSLRDIFENCLKKNSDHVAICQHVVFILENLENFEKHSGYEKRLQNLAVFKTPISTKKKSSDYHRMDSYQGRPDSEQELSHKVSFEYDFEKYEIDGLARLFGIDTWQVADDMSAVMAGVDADVTNMYDCPRGIGRDFDYRDSQKYTQGYGHYLAYHALLIVAGKYLKQFAVCESEWKENSWAEWISESVLTTPWLAELTDFFPAFIPTCDVDFSETAPKTSMVERKELAKLCGLTKEGEDELNILVDGSWKDNNGVEYHISSALVNHAETKNLAYAIASIEPFFQYLPIRDDDFGWTSRNITNPAEKWLSRKEHHSERIDETDPYGSDTVLNRSFPGPEAVSNLNLHSTDPFNREWVDGISQELFSSCSWGAHFGEGRYARSEAGSWLLGSRNIIKDFLKQKSCHLILLIKGQKYHEKRSEQGKFVAKSAVVIFAPNGTYRIIQRIPKKIINAISPLHPSESIADRLKAIQAPVLPGVGPR